MKNNHTRHTKPELTESCAVVNTGSGKTSLNRDKNGEINTQETKFLDGGFNGNTPCPNSPYINHSQEKNKSGKEQSLDARNAENDKNGEINNLLEFGVPREYIDAIKQEERERILKIIREFLDLNDELSKDENVRSCLRLLEARINTEEETAK